MRRHEVSKHHRMCEEACVLCQGCSRECGGGGGEEAALISEDGIRLRSFRLDAVC